MGWLNFTDGQDDWAHEHEGYVQGVIRADHGWRDLGLDDLATLTGHEFRIQIACTCGWRTQRMLPPLGCEWSPCSVFFDTEADEDATRDVWFVEHREHADRWRHFPSPTFSR